MLQIQGTHGTVEPVGRRTQHPENGEVEPREAGREREGRTGSSEE